MTSTADQPQGSTRGSARAAAAYLCLAVVVLGGSWLAQGYFADEQGLLVSSGPALFVAVALAIWMAQGGAPALLASVADWLARTGARASVLLLIATFIALAVIARFGFNAFAWSNDEYAYILQAQTFLRGRLWVDAPPLAPAFELTMMFPKDGKWVSPYQPGWPAILAVFEWAQLPLWLVNPLLGVAAAAAYFRLAQQVAPARVAWLVTAALVTSAFFLFNYASYFAHGAATLAGLLFACSALAYLQTGKASAAVAAGACIGYLGFIRAFNAPFFALPFVVLLIITPNRRVGLIWFMAAGAPFLLALMAYYQAVTGSPFTPVPQWARPGMEPLDGPTTSSAIETLRRLVRLQFWTSPVMLLGWAVAFASLARAKRLIFLDWIFPLTLIGFTTYGGHGGFQHGPRYLFEAWPFSLLTIARAVEPMLAAPRGRAAALVSAAILAHLTFQLSYLAPRLARQSEVIGRQAAIYRVVRAHQLNNAVVMIRSARTAAPSIRRQDLTRNGLDPTSADIVYVLEGPGYEAELRKLFPTRRFYIYADGVLREAA